MRGRPRVGFLGAGWIGRNRMAGMATAGIAEMVAVADSVPEAASAAAASIGAPQALSSLDDLLALDLDGVAIATPSALHAAQSISALDRGVAVFCQKPLGRNTGEVDAVIAAARASNRLLHVDFSYRFTDGLRKIHTLIREGALGTIYAADLTFHNAYGPDKPWFYNRELAGGGCVVDLGVHLVDLALWMVDSRVACVTSRLFSGGRPWDASMDGVEDFATMRLDFSDGATANIACSWRLPVGRPARIDATFYGTRGAVRWHNVEGSFYDFVTERLDGTTATMIGEPPDDWGPRAIVDWGRALATGGSYAPSVEQVVDVTRILDRVYGRHEVATATPGKAQSARRGGGRLDRSG
jgi:predicted dehydrogenase